VKRPKCKATQTAPKSNVYNFTDDEDEGESDNSYYDRDFDPKRCGASDSGEEEEGDDDPLG
jgi:hypothetical protein